MNWTIEQLRAFVTAAEKGSFSAAGRAMGRAQSVVSTHIAMLEDSLGVELFDLILNLNDRENHNSVWMAYLNGFVVLI